MFELERELPQTTDQSKVHMHMRVFIYSIRHISYRWTRAYAWNGTYLWGLYDSNSKYAFEIRSFWC